MNVLQMVITKQLYMCSQDFHCPRISDFFFVIEKSFVSGSLLMVSVLLIEGDA